MPEQEEKPKPAPQAKPSPVQQNFSRGSSSGGASGSAAPAWRACAIVPVYDQPARLEASIMRLRQTGLPVILVDDGSHEPTKSLCDKLAPLCARVVHHAANQGKGGAVMTGFRTAAKLGFTHALQADADGQIDLSAIPTFLRLSQKHPDELVCGYPKYDSTVPKARLWGRTLTNFWCSLNSLSLSIADAMCGLRVYPLEATTEVCASASIGKRMDFDPEILVRLLWAGVRLRNVPVAVTYPEDGVSHFRPLADNLRISWMHTKLFVRMATSFPIIIWSRIVGRCPAHAGRPAKAPPARCEKSLSALSSATSAAAAASIVGAGSPAAAGAAAEGVKAARAGAKRDPDPARLEKAERARRAAAEAQRSAEAARTAVRSGAPERITHN